MHVPLSVRAVLGTALPLAVGGVGPVLVAPAHVWNGIARWRLVFVAPMVGGLLLLGWSILLFARAGRGTLVPLDPPTLFVARGPYRVTRNPMYVGVLLWLAGLAALADARELAWYALIVGVAFHLFVWRVEEPMLRRRFGASYEAYLRRVPRWLGRWRGTLES